MTKRIILSLLRPVFGILTGAAIFLSVFWLVGYDKINTWQPWAVVIGLAVMYEVGRRITNYK